MQITEIIIPFFEEKNDFYISSGYSKSSYNINLLNGSISTGILLWTISKYKIYFWINNRKFIQK